MRGGSRAVAVIGDGIFFITSAMTRSLSADHAGDEEDAADRSTPTPAGTEAAGEHHMLAARSISTGDDGARVLARHVARQIRDCPAELGNRLRFFRVAVSANGRGVLILPPRERQRGST